MSEDTVQADKEFRKKIILFLIIVTLAIMVAEPYLRDYLDQIEQQSQKEPEMAFYKIMVVLKFLMGSVFLLLLGMGIYLILLARRISRSHQYPPPGMKVIRDTRIRTGAEAKSITILMIVSSAVLILFAFLFLCFTWAFEKVLIKERDPEEIKRNIGIEKGYDQLR
jgi:heme/copper-type cytochrome/quinol oxidase subunit 2